MTITTPVAVIGIRGAALNASYDKITGTQVTNQYGTITITNGGGTIVITRPGFTVTINNWNTPPGQPVQVTAAQGHPIHRISVEQERPERRRAGVQWPAHAGFCLRHQFDAGLPATAVAADQYRRERRAADHHRVDAARQRANTAAASNPDYYRRFFGAVNEPPIVLT